MAFKDFHEFSQPLRLPIGGVVYEIPRVSAALGLQLLGVLEGDEAALDARTPRELWALLLGEAGEQMIADGVPWAAYDRAGLAALADYNGGRDAAERAWEVGLDPEALAAMMAAAQGSQQSTSTAAESTTPSPGSGSTTTSRPGTKPADRKPKRSRGVTSSTSGSSSRPTGSRNTTSG